MANYDATFPTPNIHITIVHTIIAFSFADYLKIQFKFALHLD